MANMQTFDVQTQDGFSLTATRFDPPGASRGAILIVPAMGAAQSFYAPFAEWLAEQGWLTLTFDYRGMGASRRSPLRGFDTDLSTWATQDCAAMVAVIQQLAPHVPLLWIGHSLGGQIAGMVPGIERFSQILTIASGSGYWRQNAPPLKRRVLLLWYVLAPLLTASCGYFPGKRLKMVGDLPAGVIRQWRRWCLHPEYLMAEGEPMRQRYQQLQLPIAGLSFTDDELMTPAGIEALHALYSGSRAALEHIAPDTTGMRRIGHFGFFRPESREPLWHSRVQPVLERVSASFN